MNYIDTVDNRNYIIQNTSPESRLEMLAEEAVELAHVAQKIARVLRGEQPVDPNLDLGELKNNLVEEYADVNLAFDSIYCSLHELLPVSKTSKYRNWTDIYEEKAERWYNRLKECEDDD